jgi:glutamine synthetase
MPLFLARLSLFDGTRLDPDPRSLLKSVLDQVEAQGWQAMSGAEFEYFQFNETPKSLKEKGFTRLDALTPGIEFFCSVGV